ncbi:MAG: DNA alkylation repair protein [Tahibacter sp.]
MNKASAKSPGGSKRNSAGASAKESTEARLEEAMAWLRQHASEVTRDGMARYAIPADKALGVSMADIKLLAKRVGRDHALAGALWATDCYEARLLSSLVDDPARVTSAQMDRWCGDFDNWGICDTLCFNLFDRTPHAWLKVEQWASRREEFVKRAAFALLASLALHDRSTEDERFLGCLPWVESAAVDERNFVKKSVSWSLRAIGERSPSLHQAALKLSRKLAMPARTAAEKWIGKDVIKALQRPAVAKRLARRENGPSSSKDHRSS